MQVAFRSYYGQCNKGAIPNLYKSNDKANIVYASHSGLISASAPYWKSTLEILNPTSQTYIQNMVVSPQGEKIAIVQNKCLSTYNLTKSGLDLQSKSSINATGNIECVSWGSTDPCSIFISSGKEICEYILKDNDWKLTWSCILARPPKHILVSKSGKYFITLSDYDRFPKLWKKSASGAWEFQYLIHSRRVIYIFWGEQSSQSEKFYTFCADNNLRIWSQFQFAKSNHADSSITNKNNIFFPINAISASTVKSAGKAYKIISNFNLLSSSTTFGSSEQAEQVGHENLLTSDVICCMLEDGSVFGYSIMDDCQYRPFKPIRMSLSGSSSSYIPQAIKKDLIAMQNVYVDNEVWVLLCDSSGRIFMYHLPFSKNYKREHQSSRRFGPICLKSALDGHSHPIILISQNPYRKISGKNSLDTIPWFYSKDTENNVMLWNHVSGTSSFIYSNTFESGALSQSRLLWTPNTDEIVHIENLSFDIVQFNQESFQWRLCNNTTKLKSDYDFVYVSFVDPSFSNNASGEFNSKNFDYTLGFVNKARSTVELWRIFHVGGSITNSTTAEFIGISVLKYNGKKENLDYFFSVSDNSLNWRAFTSDVTFMTINYENNIITSWGHRMKQGRVMIEAFERHYLPFSSTFTELRFSPENKIVFLAQKENKKKQLEYYVTISNLPIFNPQAQISTKATLNTGSEVSFDTQLEQTLICESLDQITEISIYFSKDLRTYIIVRFINLIKVFAEHTKKNKDIWSCVLEISTVETETSKIGFLSFLDDLEFVYSSGDILTLAELSRLDEVGSEKIDPSTYPVAQIQPPIENLENSTAKDKERSPIFSLPTLKSNKPTLANRAIGGIHEGLFSSDFQSAKLVFFSKAFSSLAFESNSLNLSSALMKFIQWDMHKFSLLFLTDLSKVLNGIYQKAKGASSLDNSMKEIDSPLGILLEHICTKNKEYQKENSSPKSNSPKNQDLSSLSSLLDNNDRIFASYRAGDDASALTTLGNISEFEKSLDFLRLSNPDKKALSIIYSILGKSESKSGYIDTCAAKFLAFFEFNLDFYLKIMINFREATWAMLSHSQSIIIDTVGDILDVRKLGSKLNSWDYVRSLGIPLWLNDQPQLCKIVENAAKFEYSTNRNIYLVSVLYMIFNRKPVVLQLWRVEQTHSDKDKILNFLKNNFSTPRWKSAAAKNAFALLSKQRYLESIFFFLLADKPLDAASVAVNSLDDIMLAVAICRCRSGMSGNTGLLESLVKDQLLPKIASPTNSWLLIALMIRINRYDLCPLVATNKYDLVFQSLGKKYDPLNVNGVMENYTHISTTAANAPYFLSSNINSELILLLDTLYYNKNLVSYSSVQSLSPPLAQIRSSVFCVSLNMLARNGLVLVVPVALERFTNNVPLGSDQADNSGIVLAKQPSSLNHNNISGDIQNNSLFSRFLSPPDMPNVASSTQISDNLFMANGSEFKNTAVNLGRLASSSGFEDPGLSSSIFSSFAAPQSTTRSTPVTNVENVKAPDGNSENQYGKTVGDILSLSGKALLWSKIVKLIHFSALGKNNTSYDSSSLHQTTSCAKPPTTNILEYLVANPAIVDYFCKILKLSKNELFLISKRVCEL